MVGQFGDPVFAAMGSNVLNSYLAGRQEGRASELFPLQKRNLQLYEIQQKLEAQKLTEDLKFQQQTADARSLEVGRRAELMGQQIAAQELANERLRALLPLEMEQAELGLEGLRTRNAFREQMFGNLSGGGGAEAMPAPPSFGDLVGLGMAQGMEFAEAGRAAGDMLREVESATGMQALLSDPSMQGELRGIAGGIVPPPVNPGAPALPSMRAALGIPTMASNAIAPQAFAAQQSQSLQDSVLSASQRAMAALGISGKKLRSEIKRREGNRYSIDQLTAITLNARAVQAFERGDVSGLSQQELRALFMALQDLQKKGSVK